MSIIEIVEEKEISNRTDFEVGYIFGQLDAMRIIWEVHGKNKSLAKAFLSYMDVLCRLDYDLYYRVKMGFLDMIEEMLRVDFERKNEDGQ